MVTLIVALIMLVIGFYAGTFHLIERISKRVHEGTFAAMFYNKKTKRWERIGDPGGIATRITVSPLPYAECEPFASLQKLLKRRNKLI
ncbi:hypothetical protein [Klebsiella phage vB_KpnS-VAC2]|uniref:Uncharacterized protein n=1 Tax=Klebsiella phage vB_KpnS-VAC2 TaxID=2864369 RepID=A0AAE7XHE4_9CAUD|nr:hypothetical protein [Klebsiella phage vB_KpnS-VAC2]